MSVMNLTGYVVDYEVVGTDYSSAGGEGPDLFRDIYTNQPLPTQLEKLRAVTCKVIKNILVKQAEWTQGEAGYKRLLIEWSDLNFAGVNSNTVTGPESIQEMLRQVNRPHL